MNLSLPSSKVEATCDKLGVSISAIEALPAGGTHLVCTLSEGAEAIRHKLKRNLIEGRVQRFAFMRA